MSRKLAMAAALLLAGCAHGITLTPKDGIGPIGTGSAPGTLISNSGKMAVQLEGVTYNGQWTLQAGDGFVGTGITSSGGAVATGTVFGASTSGNGRAYLTSPAGGSISCAFSYSSWSETGVGECRTDKGKLYDMQIH